MPFNTISTPIVPLAADLLARILAQGGANITLTQITSWLDQYAQQSSQGPIELSAVHPDFESIKMQLQSGLGQRDSWKELLVAGVGETLLEFVSSVGSYSQMSIQRSLQEAHLYTARLASSIYTATRGLGVHIYRKQPARVTVQLISDLNYAMIPSYSQFMIGNVPYFNRDPIVFTSQALTLDVVLYQGQVMIEEVYSTGLPFQRFEIGEADFAICDEDIMIFDAKLAKYNRITDGFWRYEGAQYVFYENTTPNGNVEIRLGNGLFGRVPARDELLSIIYCRTLGSAVNNAQSGMPVQLMELNDTVPERIRMPDGGEADGLRRQIVGAVSGVTLTGSQGGDDERDKEFYRVLAPHLYSGKGYAITRPQYHAVAMTYPRMADVYLQGQQEMAPMNRNMINVVGVTPLLRNGATMTDAEFADFADWLNTKGIWKVQYLHKPPRMIEVDVAAQVFCPPNTDLPKVRTFLEYRMAEKFGVRLGTLGYSVYLNDLHDVLKARRYSVAVDYVRLLDPVVDRLIDKTDFIKIRSLSLDVDYSKRYIETYVPEQIRGANSGAITGSQTL